MLVFIFYMFRMNALHLHVCHTFIPYRSTPSSSIIYFKGL